MSILDTHTSFVKYAQERYKEAVNAESSKNAEFWLEQLQLLCQQMYWLSQAAGPPVASPNGQASNACIATMPQGVEYQSVVRNYSQTPGTIVAEHSPPVKQPTEYHWNDGFEGVTLDVWGDKQ
jgi:hypothetical protein